MVRLFLGTTKIIMTHMQHPDELITREPNLGNMNDQKRVRVTELKKGSIAYAEYKEHCHLIQKLLETSELFVEVNQDLIHRENMKRGLGKGSWKSTKQLREATRIMERLIWFAKNVRL